MPQLHPLREYRKANGLTLVELAKAAGTTDSALCLIENRKRKPGIDLAARLSRATGIPIEKFAEVAGQ